MKDILFQRKHLRKSSWVGAISIKEFSEELEMEEWLGQAEQHVGDQINLALRQLPLWQVDLPSIEEIEIQLEIKFSDKGSHWGVLDKVSKGDEIVLFVHVEGLAYEEIHPLVKCAYLQARESLSRLVGKTDALVDDLVATPVFRVLEKEKNWPKKIRLAYQILSTPIMRNEKEDSISPYLKQLIVTFKFELLKGGVMEPNPIQIRAFVDKQISGDAEVILLIGETAPNRDNVHFEQLIDRPAKGLESFVNQFAFQRSPMAAMSEVSAGWKGTTLILHLPGSSNGLKEGLSALLPTLLSVLRKK